MRISPPLAGLTALLLVACGGAAAGVAPPDAPDAVPVAPPPAPRTATRPPVSPPGAPAHWVPRVTGATSGVGGASGGFPAIHGPLQNNQGTAATVYLGKGRVGLLLDGKRAVYDAARPATVARVDGDGASHLSAASAASLPLGGGVVFTGEDGLFAAPAFDAPLLKIGDKGAAFGGFGPGVALVAGQRIVSLEDGRPVASAPPKMLQLVGHGSLGSTASTATSGFAVAFDESRAFFTRDGQHWKKLAVTLVAAAEDGADLLAELGGHEETRHFVRIDARGKIHPVPVDENDREQQATLAMRVMFGAKGQASTAYDDGFEGVLLDRGFVHTGRAPDEWIGADDARLNLVKAGARPRVVGGALPAGSMCNPFPLDGLVQLVCVELGKELTVASLDLDSGTFAPVHTITSTGLVSFMGVMQGSFPETLVVTASCAGDAKGGYCVRGPGDRWTSAPTAPADARMLPFPGEVLFLRAADDGALVVSDGKTTLRAFSAAELASIHAMLGDLQKPAAIDSSTSVVSGILRTPGGLRIVYEPNPFREPTATDRSYVVDLPLASGRPPTLTTFEGTVAFAGWHALRKTGSKVFESDDGCESWHEIALPPDGAVPSFDGAMCRRDGCTLAVWARIGWDG